MMRSILAGRRTLRLAVMAASLALVVAACTGEPNPAPTEPDGEGILGEVGGVELTAGTLLISNGTERVSIGDATVTFPGPVTDAVWSPDGSRIAYVDGDGNIATARPDGTDIVVLTATDSSVVRSRPSWSRQWIFYAEQKDDTSALRSVPTNGCAIEDWPVTGEDWPMETGDGTSFVDLAPSASTSIRPSRVAFQHDEPSGPEIWVNDTNQRVPSTYKIVDGSEPALTLDGQKLAYVGRDGDIYVTLLPATDVAGIRVATGAQHPTRLAWSPDGQHIAYATETSVQQVGATGGANAPTTLAPTTGTPSYLHGSETALFPVTAADPTALSVAVSTAGWPTRSTFFVSQGYVGAYTATIGLAERPPGPMTGGPTFLLGSVDELDPRVAAELNRIFGAVPETPEEWERPTVYVTGDVSTAVVDELDALGYLVRRQPGEVAPFSAELCPTILLFGQQLVVVDGSAHAAAMGGALASGGPVLELDGALTEEHITWLRHSSGVIESVYVIGSVPEDVRQRIAELVSGPLGFTTTHNPIAPPLS